MGGGERWGNRFNPKTAQLLAATQKTGEKGGWEKVLHLSFESEQNGSKKKLGGGVYPIKPSNWGDLPGLKKLRNRAIKKNGHSRKRRGGGRIRGAVFYVSHQTGGGS